MDDKKKVEEYELRDLAAKVEALEASINSSASLEGDGAGVGQAGPPNASIPDEGGGIDTAFYVILADDTPSEIPWEDIMSGWLHTDTNWSLEFGVTSSAFDAISVSNPTGVTSIVEYDGDASTSTAQTVYRVPIIRGGKLVCTGGVFHEVIRCKGSKGPIVGLW